MNHVPHDPKMLYDVPEGKATIEAFFEDETFWLSATIWNFRIVQKEGSRQVSREIDFYNLGPTEKYHS